MFKIFNHKCEVPAQIEELQLDMIELRALLNKTLTAVNKQLRAHGRTAQVLSDKEEAKPIKRFGIMKKYGDKITQ